MLKCFTFTNRISYKLLVCQNVTPCFVAKKQNVATSYDLRKPSVDDDSPIEMENPYQSLAPRCCLCGVRVDYKNVQLLSQFVSSFTGLQIPKKQLPLCDRKFEEVTKAIRTSRGAGYMPTRSKEPAFFNDEVLTGSIKTLS